MMGGDVCVGIIETIGLVDLGWEYCEVIEEAAIVNAVNSTDC